MDALRATFRAFIALELPPDVHDALGKTQKAFQAYDQAASAAVKWVAPASIHLTLKFLGDTPLARIDAIRVALAEAAQGYGPLTLRLGPTGCFPNNRQPRVLWVGVLGDLDRLEHVQAAVERTVAPLGFPTEGRRFSAHLTLGRVRDDARPELRQRLGAAMPALHPAPVAFTATGLNLFRSDLRPEGSVYTCVAQVPFVGAG